MVTEEDREYQTIVLAALLDDIGKLIHRGESLHLEKGQHPKLSAQLRTRASGGMHQR